MKGKLGRWNVLLLYAAILAVGLGLRLYQIDHQVLIDDEWHAIAKLATSDFRSIATSFGIVDHSIPMTLLFKWVAESGRLSEASMLALPFISGVAACVLLVLAARRSMPPLALAVFSGLLAVSPLLILYTRQARPYAMTLLLTLIAAWSAYRWAERRTKVHAAIHVVSAVIGVYSHVIVAPAIFGAWIFFLFEWAKRGRYDWRALIVTVAPGLIAFVAVSALLAPALAGDWTALRVKAGADHATVESAWRALMMMIGTGSVPFTLVMVAFAVAGTIVSHERLPRQVSYVAFMLGLQVAATLLSGALWISQQMVLARYLLICVPFLAYAMAVGLDWSCRRAWGRESTAGWLVGATVIAAAVMLGPLATVLRYPNSFVSHHVYHMDFDESRNALIPYLRNGPMPAFYQQLGRRPPGETTLIEGPWRLESAFNRLPIFQAVHRQHVKIGLVGGVCPPGSYGEHPRLFPNRFRHFIDLARPDEEIRDNGDYVVFHRKLELANMTQPWQSMNGRALPPVDRCIEIFTRRFGLPVFEDDVITVFDVRAEKRAAN